MTTKLLLLAGTEEARKLAIQLAAWPTLEIECSYAGLTSVAPIDGTTSRHGGFGGIDGLKHYLRTNDTDLVVNATHPFAVVMSTTARQACEQLALPYLRLRRAPWQPRAGERWTSIRTIDDAAMALPDSARVLVTSGRDWPVLARNRPDLCLCVRLLAKPVDNLPANVSVIVARPPFTFADERRLLHRHGCTHLLTKNAGGRSGRSKIDAAADLDLKIIVIERPAAATDQAVEAIRPAIAWVRGTIGEGTDGAGGGRARA